MAVLHVYTEFGANVFKVIHYGDISILRNFIWSPSAGLHLLAGVV